MMELEIQWSARNAGPSDDGLLFSKFARVVEARGNLLPGEVGEFSDDILCSLARGQMPQNKTDGDTSSLYARLAAQDFRVAHYVLLPCDEHMPILRFAGSCSQSRSRMLNGRSGGNARPRATNCDQGLPSRPDPID